MCSGRTSNSLDDFKVRDLAGPFEVDGKYFSSTGEVQTDAGANPDTLAAGITDAREACIIPRRPV